MSAFSLDEAIKNIRDENAVNQLVGSLEKSLECQVDPAKYANSDMFKAFFNELTTTANSAAYSSSSYAITPTVNSVNLTKRNISVDSINFQSNKSKNNQLTVHPQLYNSATNNHQQEFNNFVAGQQQQQNKSGGYQKECLSNNNIMPKNEPVKLVYPTSQNSSSSAATIVMNNNRATFSSAPLPNGTITLSTMTANSLTQPNQQQQQATAATMMQGRNNQQTPTLIFKNASNSTAGTLITTTTPVSVSKANSQTSNIVALPSNLLVNIRPQTATTGAQNVQKTTATVGQQRVVNVINQQVVRPQSNTITLSNLPQNMQGNTILLKQDNGSYQLLRISTQPGTTPSLTPTGGNTIRLQTVPAASMAPSNTILVTSTASTQQQQQQILTTAQSTITQVPALTTTQQTHQQQHHTGTVVVQQSNNANTTRTTSTTASNVVVTQSPAQRNDNAKEKCRKFLTNLIDLSKREPAQVEMNVKTLIQELVDANVGPEDFCKKLENLLNAAPQPCLVGFLKRSLPLLRQSLVTKETVIEGINPPSPSVAFSGATITTTQIPAQIRPIGQTVVSGIGQTQIRMVSQPGPPRIGQTTIRPTIPQTLIRTTAPAMRPLTTIRGQTTIVQTHANQVPALHPVSGTILSNSGAQGSAARAKEKKSSLASVAGTASTISGNNAMSNFYPSTFGDDDINDVAAMGGVNLAEESQKILGSTEYVGTQIRSCKDEVLLNLNVLQQRIRQQMARHGLDEPPLDVAILISHASQEYLKNITEKLSVIAEHRMDILKMDQRYETTTDVRGQIKFLEELDKAEQKRHEEVEREMLIRAAKSRSKTEDPEQAKLKAKAKEMQRAELEELRHREANNTALQAIGPRKRKHESDIGTSVTGNGTNFSTPGVVKTTAVPRPRIKRVNMRDMIFYMEQEKDTCRSSMLYKYYLK